MVYYKFTFKKKDINLFAIATINGEFITQNTPNGEVLKNILEIYFYTIDKKNVFHLSSKKIFDKYALGISEVYNDTFSNYEKITKSKYYDIIENIKKEIIEDFHNIPQQYYIGNTSTNTCIVLIPKEEYKTQYYVKPGYFVPLYTTGGFYTKPEKIYYELKQKIINIDKNKYLPNFIFDEEHSDLEKAIYKRIQL